METGAGSYSAIKDAHIEICLTREVESRLRTGLEDLSLSPSILLGSGCRWHGFVEKGEIRTA